VEGKQTGPPMSADELLLLLLLFELLLLPLGLVLLEDQDLTWKHARSVQLKIQFFTHRVCIKASTN
jgi:hypothetical protein